MNNGGKARTTGTARHDSLATGEAKPRRTSGGGAGALLLLLTTFSVGYAQNQGRHVISN